MGSIQSIQLITTTTTDWQGPNQGAGTYPAGGLLTLAAALRVAFPGMQIWIDDEHHGPVSIRSGADVVGVQAASTTTWGAALRQIEAAKSAGKMTIVGGPHITALYERVMANRNSVDFAIRGRGETPLVELVGALNSDSDFGQVPSLSWRDSGSAVHNTALSPLDWEYDQYTPLPLGLLSAGVEKYWGAYRTVYDRTVDAAFLVFTHFGCGFRQVRTQGRLRRGLPILGDEQRATFCSYCSLDDPPLTRDPERILAEIHAYMSTYRIPQGSRIHLKCYGDNIGPQRLLVKALARAIAECSWWRDYRFTWEFYCQSSYLNEDMAEDLRRIGTSRVYIGFDGANDEVQRRNGLGTSIATHRRAVELCLKYGIKIVAGSVVGLVGETPDSLEDNYEFNEWLVQTGACDRIESATIFIIPKTHAYELLATREPHIRELDLLLTDEIRALWIRHFCPSVTLDMLRRCAESIDALSPARNEPKT